MATVLPLFTYKNISGTRGESVEVDIEFPGRDLTGTRFRAFVYAPQGKTSVLEPQVTLLSASEGKIRITLSAAQTAKLSPTTEYVWSLRQSYNGGSVKNTQAGTLKVKNP